LQSINYTLNPSFENLLNMSQANMLQLLDILQSNNDISACLANCSNQGFCQLNTQTLKYICECNENFMGKSCQTDVRPCSQSNKCLNNGTCINSQDLISSSCQCPEGIPFYGQYCENLRDLCENMTCSSHGYCIQNLSETKCKCFNGYEGDVCDKELNKVKKVKYTQWTTTIICVVCIIIFWLVIITSDILDYFKIGSEHVDMDEWRHEKLHGKKDEVKRTKNTRNNVSIQTFQYVPWASEEKK
jgi:hypothetical protein